MPTAPVSGGSDAPVLVYATFPAPEAAEQVGGALVEAGLAACVNIIPGMRSVYRWQGAIERSDETVAIIKTRRSLAPRVIGWVRVAHAYANPALVVLPVAGGSPDFLAWILDETTPPA